MNYTLSHALVLSMIVAASYVVAFQSFKPAHIIGKDRNDPTVIYHRIWRISLLCIVLVFGVPWLLEVFYDNWQHSYASTLVSYGLLPGCTKTNDFTLDLVNILKAIGLISVLYVGPIADYLIKSRFNLGIVLRDFASEFLQLDGFRDHVFAPITEEIIYRSIIVNLLSPFTNSYNLIVYTPLLFGIAHIHHGYDLYVHKNLELSMVIMNGFVQLIYTSLFGILANYLFIQRGQGNIWCAIVVHSICNLIGFPELVVISSSSTNPRFWPYIYYTLLVVGIYTFAKLI